MYYTYYVCKYSFYLCACSFLYCWLWMCRYKLILNLMNISIMTNVCYLHTVKTMMFKHAQRLYENWTYRILYLISKTLHPIIFTHEFFYYLLIVKTCKKKCYFSIEITSKAFNVHTAIKQIKLNNVIFYLDECTLYTV